MWLFNNKDQYQGCNVSSIKEYLDKKRIVFNIVVSILTIITLMLVIHYILDTRTRIEKSKQFVSQIIEYQQEQQRLEIQKEEERKAKIPELTEVGKENLKNIYQSETKRAFLTFDDGPSTNTKDILNILKENNIKATFFVLGRQVEEFPETTNRIYNEGHYIANHGYSHQYSSIYQSGEQVVNEYNQCNQIIANTINVPEYNSHLFRFPGGSIRRKICKYKTTGNSTIRTK